MELLLGVILSLLLVPLAIFASGALRIALGLIFVLFFPGYTLIAALFPRKTSLGSIERLALSFGLSIAVVPLLGLLLNYMPWGIRLYPILISLLIFICAMAAIAWFRRQRLTAEERFEPRLRLALTSVSRLWASQGQRDKVLTILLILAILGAIGTLGYIIAKPKVGERFTEFYILGAEVKAEDYPRELAVGEKGQLILGIVNKEHERISYRVEIQIDGGKVGELAPLVLEHEERWEQEVEFIPARAGPNQKVEFVLYKGEATEVYRRLHLWIDVKEEGK